jgi:hypothetical protein
MPTITPLTKTQEEQLREHNHDTSFYNSLVAMLTVSFTQPEKNAIRKFIESVKWDTAGHRGVEPKRFIEEIFHDNETLLKLHKLLTNEIIEANIKARFCTLSCYTCGEDVSRWKCTKSQITAATECTCKELIYKFSIDIPSGKMVVANDLRGLIKLTGDCGSVNQVKGCRDLTQAYAQAGLAHACVGNTCPSVYKNGSKFLIGSRRKDKSKAFTGFKQVASICTDLWWYSIMDLDWFKQCAGRDPNEDEEIVSCEPGRYEFTHYYHQLRDKQESYTKSEVFTKIRRTGKAGVPTDPYTTLTYSAEDVIFSQFNKDWYAERKDNAAIYSAVDHLMCCIGNGAEYHPNGWWGYEPLLTTLAPADFKLDTITGKVRWYPLCEYSVVCQIAHKTIPKVHPSFVKLTHVILNHILSDDGAVITAGTDAKADKQALTAQRKVAAKLLLTFKKNYPEFV